MIKHNLKPATKRDFDFFFKEEKILHSAKAWVLKSGRKRYALGGVWLIPGQFTSFVRVRDNLPKKEFWIISKIVTEELKKLNIPIVCERDSNVLNSKKYLEKLGYEFYTVLNNKEIFRL